MIRYKSIALLLFTIAISSLNACKHDYPEPVGPTISFKDHVQPIIAGNCTAAECHPATGGEFPLVSYNDVITNGEIKDGGGELIEVLKETDEDERMPKPPSPALSADQIKIIELWITQGAKNN